MPHCNQCEQDWEQRKLGGDPVQCPRCHRTDWREPKKGKNGNRDVKTVAGDIGGRGASSSVRRRERVSGNSNPSGKISSKDSRIASAPSEAIVDTSPDFGEVKTCRACEGDLRRVRGKLVCMKLDCGMMGQEQGEC
jgi:hypothetical protein